MAVNLFKFYESILSDELCFVYGDEEEEMESSMDILLASYSVSGLKIADSLDFNSRQLRCAYLFLFSTSHSHMVIEALNRLHEENYTELLDLICRASSTHGSFNITSLGGGPGSDPLGILTFLDEKGIMESCPLIKVTVVDEYIGWESIFRKVMNKFDDFSVRAHFTTQDLLLSLSIEVEELLKSTHFLSMVKFVSAVSGDKYGAILSFQRIFNLLRPGTIVLIIDNAGGQDFNQALGMAKNMGLLPILEPILHYKFQVPKMQEQGLGRMKYGKRPQSSSTISIAILKKSGYSSSSYFEPTSRFVEPSFRNVPVRNELSNGRQTGSNSCSNNSFETLPPILNRLLLASEYNNRSSKATSQSNAGLRSPSSTNNGLNFQFTAQNQTSASSPYGTTATLFERSPPKPAVSNYNNPSSSYGINRASLVSAQPKTSGSSYGGLNYQPNTPSKPNATTNSPFYGRNPSYLESAQSKPSGSPYGLNYQYITQAKTNAAPVSSIQGASRCYSERPYSQFNPYTSANTTASRRPAPKKEESKCCLL